MIEKLKKASPVELEAWMLSAAFLGLGLGAYLGMALMPVSLWILLAALIVHIYTMVRIYSR